MVSQYNLAPEARYGIKNLFHVISKRIKMQGFIQGDENMGPKYSKERDEKVSAVSSMMPLNYSIFHFSNDNIIYSGW